MGRLDDARHAIYGVDRPLRQRRRDQAGPTRATARARACRPHGRSGLQRALLRCAPATRRRLQAQSAASSSSCRTRNSAWARSTSACTRALRSFGAASISIRAPEPPCGLGNRSNRLEPPWREYRLNVQHDGFSRTKRVLQRPAACHGGKARRCVVGCAPVSRPADARCSRAVGPGDQRGAGAPRRECWAFALQRRRSAALGDARAVGARAAEQRFLLQTDQDIDRPPANETLYQRKPTHFFPAGSPLARPSLRPRTDRQALCASA